MSKSLVAMKEILYGTNEKEPQTEAVAQLAQELYNSGLLGILIADLQLIDFEVRLEALLSESEAEYAWRLLSMTTRSVFISALSHTFRLRPPGEERRGSDLQQHPQASDRYPDTHSGVSVHSAEHPLHVAQRVRIHTHTHTHTHAQGISTLHFPSIKICLDYISHM